MRIPTKTLYGQPSFILETRTVRLAVTERGGHMAPVRFFRNSQSPFEPYRIALWHAEKLAKALPTVLRPLRGDFFCAPFGGNDQPWKGEKHPVHGETASGKWKPMRTIRCPCGAAIELTLRTTIRPGIAAKRLALVEGENVVYGRDELRDMKGPMCLGHHATLAFPDQPGCGLISLGPFRYGRVYPGIFEKPEEKGYQILKPGAEFADLSRVERIDGAIADLNSYPARRGFEDLVMVCADPAIFPAWSTVTFPEQRVLWFTLRDPAVLASTILWHDNGGRHYPPWNGRSINTLGIEDVTAHFADGLAVSAAPNPVNNRGIPTCVTLSPSKPFAVNYIQGVARVPRGFGRVKEVAATRPGAVVFRDDQGTKIEAAVRWEFLKTGLLGVSELDIPAPPSSH